MRNAAIVPARKLRPARAPTAMLITALGLPAAALADQFDTLNFTAGLTVLQDDNVFRLSSAADPNRVLGKPSRSDTITVKSAGIRFNKPYSLQRFELGFNLVDYKYENFGFLSFTARNYDAAWRWSLTPRFRGNLTTNRQQTLSSFTDFTGFVRNLRTVESTRGDATYELDGVWRLIGSATEIKATNSQVFLEDSDNKFRTLDAGLRYALPSGSFAQVVARTGAGEFFKRAQPNFAAQFDTAFDQNELEGRLNWAVTGKSIVRARLAWLERKHQNFAQRDYSGWVGNLDGDWGISGRTRLSGSVTSELSSFQSASASYVRTNRVSVGPTVEIGAQAVARARLEYSTRNFLGPVAAPAFNNRVDTITSASVGVDWQPFRFVTLSASLQNDRRSSNLAGFDFKDTTATLAAQLTF